MPLTSYSVDETRVALLRLERAEARNAINTEMLDELLAHLDRAKGEDEARVLVVSSNDHLGSLGRRRRPRGARRAGQGPPHGALRSRSTTSSRPSRSPRSRPATARWWVAAPRSRSPATSGSAAPTSGCASPAPSSAFRSGPPAWSRSAASPPRSTSCSPRAASAPTRPCGWASSTGSRRRRPPRTPRSPRRRGGRPPTRGGCPAQGDAPSLGRGGRALGRRRARAGRVAAQRPRPAFPGPHRRLKRPAPPGWLSSIWAEHRPASNDPDRRSGLLLCPISRCR